MPKLLNKKRKKKRITRLRVIKGRIGTLRIPHIGDFVIDKDGNYGKASKYFVFYKNRHPNGERLQEPVQIISKSHYRLETNYPCTICAIDCFKTPKNSSTSLPQKCAADGYSSFILEKSNDPGPRPNWIPEDEEQKKKEKVWGLWNGAIHFDCPHCKMGIFLEQTEVEYLLKDPSPKPSNVTLKDARELYGIIPHCGTCFNNPGIPKICWTCTKEDSNWSKVPSKSDIPTIITNKGNESLNDIISQYRPSTEQELFIINRKVIKEYEASHSNQSRVVTETASPEPLKEGDGNPLDIGGIPETTITTGKTLTAAIKKEKDGYSLDAGKIPETKISNPKRITIEKGIVAIYKNGTIINFPNGNDEEYQLWCKDNNIEGLILICSPEGLSEELERLPPPDPTTYEKPQLSEREKEKEQSDAIKKVEEMMGAFEVVTEDLENCHLCEGTPINGRMWWEKGIPEYPNDGTLMCDFCAYDKIHQYDDFDPELYKKCMEEEEGPKLEMKHISPEELMEKALAPCPKCGKTPTDDNSWTGSIDKYGFGVYCIDPCVKESGGNYD